MSEKRGAKFFSPEAFHSREKINFERVSLKIAVLLDKRSNSIFSNTESDVRNFYSLFSRTAL